MGGRLEWRRRRTGVGMETGVEVEKDLSVGKTGVDEGKDWNGDGD